MQRRSFITALGGAVVLVLPLSAQTVRRFRMGLLSTGSFSSDTNPGRLTEDIERRLAQNGLTTGTNLELIKRGAEGHPERLPALVAELAAAKVDVIVAFSYPAAVAAKEGTSSLPIVIFGTGDPVVTHLVDSLNRPGGNVTGISDVAAELAPKRLELLKQAAPKLRRVAVLWNAKDLGMTTRYRASAAAAKELGVTVMSFGVGEPNDFGDAFETMGRDMPDGLLMVADALTFLNRKRVFDFAAEHHLPAIYETSSFARDGGLMSYGPDEQETADHGASLILRILKGEKPANLPLEQPTRYRLVINLKTSKALGLTIPPGLLISADEVIE